MVVVGLLDRLFTRRRSLPQFSAASRGVRRRLERACRELSEAEGEMAQHLRLSEPPRLLLVDEEAGIIVFVSDRAEISGNREVEPRRGHR